MSRLLPCKSLKTIADPTSDFDAAQAALAALSRAGLRGAEESRRTNTYIVVEEDGRVLHESPQEHFCKRSEQPSPSSIKTSA